jgi:FMN phosphatase YigB (HAD superfamily)
VDICVERWRILQLMKPYIFVDLDETLIHTYDFHEMPCKCAVPVTVEEVQFKTSLRPGAKEFLAKLREIGEVRMLTIATYDYAIEMNRLFDLGFVEKDIYARHHIQAPTIDLKPAEFVYLFDNLPLRENRRKIEFLRCVTINKIPSYIQVKEYRGGQRFPFDKEEIDRLTKALYESNGTTTEDTERALYHSRRETD